MSEHPILPSDLLSGSHAQFLEQLSNKEFWSYAAELARSTSVPQTRLEEYLECKGGEDSGGGKYLLPLGILREVVSPPHHFTLLPGSPLWMHGIAAWRGEIIAVVDLDAYFTGSSAQPHADGMVVVAQVDKLLVGLFVASVGEMITTNADQVVPLEQARDGNRAHNTTMYTRVAGAAKGVYADALVLDIPIILADIIEQIRITASI